MGVCRSGDSGKGRGQSSPIAVVLVFGLVIGATTVTLLVGGVAISDTQDQLGLQTAENTMTQLDSQASLVALGTSNAQRIRLGSTSRGGYHVVDGGKLTVRIHGESTPIIETELGSIVYEGESGTKLAYQGGGVWGTDGNGNARMISPPELRYRNKTLTLPLVTVAGDKSLGDEIVVTQNGSEKVFPSSRNSRTNPITRGGVEVTIQSEYYGAWAEYLRSRTDGGVETDRSNNEVTLKLLQQDKRVIEQAAFIGGSTGELEIQSGNTIVVDSYNSSTATDLGPNSRPGKQDGADVQTTMDIALGGNAEIEGNLTTGGSINKFTGAGQPKSGIDGNLRYGDGSVSDSDCDKYVSGWCNDNASIEQPEKIDNEVTSSISGIQSENNNSETNCLSAADALKYGDGSCGSSSITLEAGDYYVDNAPFRVDSNQKLLLDTSSGDINIAIDGPQLDIDGNVTVIGDGRVNVYLKDQVKIDSSNSKIWNRGWNAEQFWVYCEAGCEIDVQKGVFNGVIYAPPDPDGGNGEVTITSGAEVYGAIMAGGGSTAELKSNAEIHFDESLRSTTVFQRATVPSISYLHVSVNRINVTGS